MKLLTNQADREEARLILSELLGGRAEWLCSESRGREGARPDSRGSSPHTARGVSRGTSSVRRGEWELSAVAGALRFSFWSDEGAQVWRVAGWARAGAGLVLAVTRRGGAERATLELVPRASAREAAAEVASARRAACERLGALACESLPGAKIESARLSRGARRSEPGRYARVVLLRRGARGRVAVTGALVPLRAHEADAVLASALAWWLRVDEKGSGGSRKSEAASTLRLVAGRELSKPLAERVALLRDGVRDRVTLFEADDALKTLTPLEVPRLDDLLDAAPRPLLPHARSTLSETAARIVALAPEEIDAVRARHGETMRFRGLPFARVRRLPEGERVWFGTPGARRKLLLGEDNWPRLVKLLDELSEHRRASAADRRHAFYRAAPEAWLESILRRDITRLDPGLVVSPLHVQFRTAREASAGARPVDLLALRRDGRLVVIELKVAEDAALPLQGADYWRRVETHRRSGDLARARLFGDLKIADAPALVYLVAPVFRFARNFAALARLVSPEIDLYRFDINEDWRAGVRVVRREGQAPARIIIDPRTPRE